MTMLKRITKKDCDIQLKYIVENLLRKKINLSVHVSNGWKMLYQSGDMVVSAPTWREFYYQLVAYKRGIELAINERL